MKWVSTFLGFAFILLLGIIFPSFSFADDIIEGHYCYTYGDSESLKEARELTRTLAIRNAIESYRVFITSTSNVKNFSLTNDRLQIITSGHLRDVKVVYHKEEGKTICDQIQATISAKAVAPPENPPPLTGSSGWIYPPEEHSLASLSSGRSDNQAASPEPDRISAPREWLRWQIKRQDEHLNALRAENQRLDRLWNLRHPQMK